MLLTISLDRTYPDVRLIVEGLRVQGDGGGEPWYPPATGRLAGTIDFKPLPPCMIDICNSSGERPVGVGRILRHHILPTSIAVCRILDRKLIQTSPQFAVFEGEGTFAPVKSVLNAS